MGLFSKFFERIKTRFLSIGSYYSRSSPWNKDLYEQETVRAIIDCIATHAAKAEAMHVVVDENGRIKEIKRRSPYARLLNMQPNALMTGFDLKYKLITQREHKTTALAYISWTTSGNMVIPESIIPISYSNFEFLPVEGGGYAVKFTDYEGRQYTLWVEEIVILRKFYNSYDVSGEGNNPIYNTLDMIKASDEGLIEALSVSNKVRGLLKQKKAMLDSADVERVLRNSGDGLMKQRKRVV